MLINNELNLILLMFFEWKACSYNFTKIEFCDIISFNWGKNAKHNERAETFWLLRMISHSRNLTRREMNFERGCSIVDVRTNTGRAHSKNRPKVGIRKPNNQIPEMIIF